MQAGRFIPPLYFFKNFCIIAIISICNISFNYRKVTGDKELIRLAQQKGVSFLIKIQRHNGAICDTINPLFDTWETILAATAIYRSDTGEKNSGPVKKALAFLKNSENNKGLICHNQKCKKAYCLETTSVYFNLLQLTGKDEKITSALKTIASLQKQSGEWEIGNPDVTVQKAFPSVTAFVLNTLQNKKAEPLYKKNAIDWLLQKQTAQGDWGAAWEYYGCPAYALWPIMKVLQNENAKEAVSAKDKAITFILASQNDDGSWFYRDAALQKQTSPALQTALMLSALQNAGIKSTEAVLKGINFLVKNQQENGGWEGGFFPIPQERYTKQEYVFATALAVDLMRTYLLNNNN
ncbi:MAG: hypothetical protein JNM14_04400 [Ferruginibacter sp.]|nr:hypothetical protein [Ferruginibacter sp.]